MRLHDRGLLERLCKGLEWKPYSQRDAIGARQEPERCVGGQMIYFVALPFVRVEGGLAPGEPVECPHAAAAIRRASDVRSRAKRGSGGVLAAGKSRAGGIRRSGDPQDFRGSAGRLPFHLSVAIT